MYVWMWELGHKEGWALKDLCFWSMVLETTLKMPLDCKELKPVNSKGNQPWIFIEGLTLKVKLQYFGHVMGRADSLEKTLMLGKIEDGRERGQQRMRWLGGITRLINMSLSKFQKMVQDKEAWHAAAHGVTKSRTQLSGWTTTTNFILFLACLPKAGDYQKFLLIYPCIQWLIMFFPPE